MDWNNELTLLLSGAILGLTVAAIGAAVDYRRNLSRIAQLRQRHTPGCLIYVTAGLGLAGIVALFASFLLTGGLRPALIIGAGVLGGFYTGFILLLALWLYLDARRAS